MFETNEINVKFVLRNKLDIISHFINKIYFYYIQRHDSYET